MSEKRFPDVPGGYPFPRLEQEVLAEWQSRSVFEKTLEKPSPKGEFVFFEGPPTANNVPHVGHVVTRVVKDLFPRFRTMRGYHVARKAGWDTHGLAVEIEVEKRLGFSGKQQIEAYGIAEFNKACLESVHVYERQWRAMTERIGYWTDLDHAYLTYTNEYVESVWWALSGARRARPSQRGLQDPALLRPLRHHPFQPRGGPELQGRGRSVHLDPVPRPAGTVDPHDDGGRVLGDPPEPLSGRLDHDALDDPRQRRARRAPRSSL